MSVVQVTCGCLLPSVPLAIFNGVLVESEPCSGVGDSIGEVEERGLPCGVQLREGQHPEVEAEARAMGLTERTPMPGMTLAFEELVEASCDALEISRVEDEAGLLDAATVAASAFGAPPAVLQALYSPEVAEMDGMSVYLGHVDAGAVTTGMGYRTGREGAIFSVATPDARTSPSRLWRGDHRLRDPLALRERSRPRVVADNSYRGARLLPTRIPSGRQPHSA